MKRFDIDKLPWKVIETIDLSQSDVDLFNSLMAVHLLLSDAAATQELSLDTYDGDGNVVETHTFRMLKEEKKCKGQVKKEDLKRLEKEGKILTDKDIVQVAFKMGEGYVLRVIIRLDCLYLIGFCTESDLFELPSVTDEKTDKDVSILAGARMLKGVSVSYRDLKFFRKADGHLDVQCKISWEQLRDAVCKLSRTSSRKPLVIPRHFALIIIMLLEGARLSPILPALRDGGMTMGELDTLVHGWGSVSCDLCQHHILSAKFEDYKKKIQLKKRKEKPIEDDDDKNPVPVFKCPRYYNLNMAAQEVRILHNQMANAQQEVDKAESSRQAEARNKDKKDTSEGKGKEKESN